MNCHICNFEMTWGYIFLKGGPIDWLFGYMKRHLFFDAYNPQAKPVKVIEWGQYIKGFYCDNCGGVCLNNKNSSSNCMYCNQNMIYGDFYIRKSKVGQFVRNSLNHLYFIGEDSQRPLKILDGDEYVRGFYCGGCRIIYFNSKQSKVN